MKLFSIVYLFLMSLVLFCGLSYGQVQAEKNSINPAVLEIIEKLSNDNQIKLAPLHARSARLAQPVPLDMEIVWN